MQKKPERITVRIEVISECGHTAISEHSSDNPRMTEAASLMGYCFRAVDNFLKQDLTEDVVDEFQNSAFQAN